MRSRSYILAALLIALGVAVNVRGLATKSTVHTKAWLSANTPTEVGDFKYVPGPDGSNETYQMDIPALNASGIVSRVYRSGPTNIDVVVIDSDRGESFHDPAGCFKAQDWEVLRQKQIGVPAGSIGTIPMNSLTIKGHGEEKKAAYCFRNSRQIFAGQSELLRSLFVGELMTAKPQEGTMYRFIGLNQDITEAQLFDFIGKYMEKALLLDSR